MKMTKMRNKTKDELSKLAEIMVSKYQIDTILGTGDFLENALSEGRINNLDIDRQSIKRYEKELAMRCKALNEHIQYQIEQDFIKKERKSQPVVEQVFDLELDDNFYNVYSDVVDDMAILKRAVEIMNRIINKDAGYEFFDELTYSAPVVKVPEYTFFVESEDGLMYIKGKFKNELVTGRNIAHNGPYTVTEKGYAEYILKENREGRGNLTQDDAAVFTSIALGHI